MVLDVVSLRAEFPSLNSGIAHFDGPGGTQTPRAVGTAIAEAITGPLSNRGRTLVSDTNADDAVVAFRHAFADLLGADPRGVVFGRSATQITYDFSRNLAKQWGRGDEIVVSRIDHDSNIRPWIQAAEAVGATVRWIEFDAASAEITMDAVEAALSSRTKLVAITGASNLLGTKPPLRTIADRAHAVGALMYVDGVHYTAHEFVDVRAIGADFYVCSPYKFLGPHCAVLVADPTLLETVIPDKLLPSSNAVPERFEFGTLPYEIMAGSTAAVDFLAAIAPGMQAHRRDRLRSSFEVMHAHETRLRQRFETGVEALHDRAELLSRAADRTPTVYLVLPGRRCQDAFQFLAGRKVLAPVGHFYAYEAFRALGLADTHGMRVGIAPYTDDQDVDRLLEGLRDFVMA